MSFTPHLNAAAIPGMPKDNIYYYQILVTVLLRELHFASKILNCSTITRENSRLWHPTLQEKGAAKIHRCLWTKETAKLRGPTKSYKVLLVNDTLGMETVTLVSDLL